MPKEQPCLTENSPCAPSSKNAKDKSNNRTLLAIRNNKDTHDSSGRGSSCSSEKDSGFSDGSDWQQNDAEDQKRNKSPSRCSEHAETLHLRNPGKQTLIPLGCDIPPVCIVKNMVPKQQPGLSPSSLQLHKPLSLKSSATGKKINCSYLPIFNSYPRIAPHPGKKPPDKASSNESHSLGKRSLSEQPLYRRQELVILTSGLASPSSAEDSLSSSSLSTVSSNLSSPSVSSLGTSSSFLLSRGSHRNSTSSSRHHRFLNTVEILRKSGLLDITMRTKELLRRSNTTGQDIAQLRQHAELLCQAACNPASGVAGWEHLHRAMAESGSYPNLKTLQNLQSLCYPDSACQPEVQPSSLPPAEPDSNQNCPVQQQTHSPLSRELSSEDVTFMTPDSSTG